MKTLGTLAVIGIGNREDPRVQKRAAPAVDYQIYASCPRCRVTKVFTVPLGVTVENFVCPACNERLMRAW